MRMAWQHSLHLRCGLEAAPKLYTVLINCVMAMDTGIVETLHAK